MTRLYGSSDLFPDDLDNAYHSYQTINYITSHDGFCLYDLVAYNTKHNLANGQNNSDGTDNNLSWNCGWEGDQDVPAEVMQLRTQQVKNFFTILMVSNGTPMFCAGDEFMNTQRGNNNPWNQDNETTWLDWGLLEKNKDTRCEPSLPHASGTRGGGTPAGGRRYRATSISAVRCGSEPPELEAFRAFRSNGAFRSGE